MLFAYIFGFGFAHLNGPAHMLLLYAHTNYIFRIYIAKQDFVFSVPAFETGIDDDIWYW